MYPKNLNACHLELLKMTVGRFYANGVAILDPVLSHLVGTYSFRSLQDRQDPGEEEAAPEVSMIDVEDLSAIPAEEQFIESGRPFEFSTSQRRLLEFTEHPGGRKDYPRDTFVLPPKLPVLGHNIRHWSGGRRNGSTAAATTGYPLNVGRVKKYYRRRAAHEIRTTYRNRDWLEYGTYRMKDEEHYHRHPPGSVEEPPAPEGAEQPPT
jgi:hypothetical protein